MAKKVPCGGCGELRWPSAHAGAPSVPLCRKCRSEVAQHGTLARYRRGCKCEPCVEAKRLDARAYWRAKYSGGRRAGSLMVRDCVACGVSFNPRSNQKLCSPECRKATLGRLGDHASRAAHYGVAYEVVRREEIFDHDNWQCGICGLPIDPAEVFPAPGAATLDHVVPMSRGGAHVAENLQAAHFYCNTVKGNRLEEAAC